MAEEHVVGRSCVAMLSFTASLKLFVEPVVGGAIDAASADSAIC